MTPDRFLGAWRVTEHVFDPGGAPIGVIRQTRSLERMADGRARVVQRMTPSPSLADHPMAEFAGEWTFDLVVDGRARRYLGPDVVGTGLTWGDGVTTGRGVWPRFGHTFTSFGMLTPSGRQLTGGKFYNAGEMVANIIGVATPMVADDDAFPALTAPYDPQEVRAAWRCAARACAADGAVLGESSVSRRYTTDGFIEAGLRVACRPAMGRDICEVHVADSSTTLRGVGKRTGWLYELEAHGPNGISLEWMEIFDSVAGGFVGLRRWRRDDALERVEVVWGLEDRT